MVEADLRQVKLPRREFLVVASPPFSLTTALCRRLLGDPGVRLAAAELIISDGAARWLASPRPRDAETAWWTARYQVRLTRTVGAASFAPPPSVAAARLSIRPRPTPAPAQRQLRALLRAAYRGPGARAGTVPAIAVLASTGAPGGRRLLIRAGDRPRRGGRADHGGAVAPARAAAGGHRQTAGTGRPRRVAATIDCMTEPHHDKSGTAAYRAARDLLLRHREDYESARAEFAWPQLDEFNWALDWFDVLAAEHPDRDALRVVTAGSDIRLSYAQMAARSNQVANWLRDLGARRGDRVLLMLGNIAPLWEVILASIKLGAVIIPASTLLGPEDLADRIARGDVRHVITEDAHTPKFEGLDGTWTRVVVGAATPGWHHYDDATSAPPGFTPDGVDEGQRPAAAVLHLGHHRAAEAGRAHARVVPGRAPVHDVLDRPAARRRAPEHLLPRLGQARLEQRVRAVDRGRDLADPRPRAVQRAGAVRRAARAAG